MPWRLAVLTLCLASAPLARAEDAPKQEEEKLPWEVGPKHLTLGHALSLDLPEGFISLPREPAQKLMERMGNFHNDNLLALVARPETGWFITVRYIDDGYVKDDEAEKLDADAILQAIKEGAEEANKVREQRGFPPFHVEGWTDLPRYERARHQVIWGTKASSKRGVSHNYTTRLLGRNGLASLTLVAEPEEMPEARPHLPAVLDATRFDPGARYEDFQEGKDRVAEYGLAALVAGGAGAAALKLAKVGLLAKFGGKLLALLLAGKKFVVLAVAGLLALLRKLFGKKPAPEVPPTGVP